MSKRNKGNEEFKQLITTKQRNKMCSNNPFNMPRQISPIVKTPTYAAAAACNEHGTSHFATYEEAARNMVENKDALDPPRKGLRRSFRMKTHYSSSIDSPALSDSCVSYAANVLSASPLKDQQNCQVDSQVSFCSKRADSLMRLLRGPEAEYDSRHKEKALRNAITEARGVLDRHSPELSPHVAFNSKKGSIGEEITQKEYEELYARKNELYGAFTSRYTLSPTTLNKFFDVASLEKKYLRKIKHSAEEVVRARRAVSQNRTECPSEKSGLAPDSLPGFVSALREFADCLGADEVTKEGLSGLRGRDMIERLGELLPRITEYVSEKQRKFDVERVNMVKKCKELEAREALLSRKETELVEKEETLEARATEVNARLEKCEQWQQDILKEKTQFRVYKEKKKEMFRLEEGRLRFDWEKLQVLEADVRRRKDPPVILKQANRRPPPAAVAETARKSRPTSVCHGNHRATRRSMDIYSSRNKENVSHADNTDKFA